MTRILQRNSSCFLGLAAKVGKIYIGSRHLQLWCQLLILFLELLHIGQQYGCHIDGEILTNLIAWVMSHIKSGLGQAIIAQFL